MRPRSSGLPGPGPPRPWASRQALRYTGTQWRKAGSRLNWEGWGPGANVRPGHCCPSSRRPGTGDLPLPCAQVLQWHSQPLSHVLSGAQGWPVPAALWCSVDTRCSQPLLGRTCPQSLSSARPPGLVPGPLPPASPLSRRCVPEGWLQPLVSLRLKRIGLHTCWISSPCAREQQTPDDGKVLSLLWPLLCPAVSYQAFITPALLRQ